MLKLDGNYGDEVDEGRNALRSSNRLTTTYPNGQSPGLGLTMQPQPQQQQPHRQPPSQKSIVDTISRPSSGSAEHVFTGLGMYSPGMLQQHVISFPLLSSPLRFSPPSVISPYVMFLYLP